MNKLLHIGCITLFVSLAACRDSTSAGDSDPGAGQPPGTAPPSAGSLDCSTPGFAQRSTVDALPGGIWQGSLVDCANKVQHDGVTAMVSEDGRFRILDEYEHLLAGVLQTTGDLFAGGGVDFATPGVEYFSGPTTHLWVDGRVAERQTLEGRWGTEWGFYGYFIFDYVQQSYARPTSLADLVGVWPVSATYLRNPVEGVWTIAPNGWFSGQDDLGCLQSGQFSLIDDRYNIVSVQLEVTDCELAGSYTGLATLQDLVDRWEKSITVSVDDGARALRIVLAIEQP